jgi:hypothetical protein
MNQLPRPKKIAENMMRLCKKLINGGDTALVAARVGESPLRARRYDTHEGRRHQGSLDDAGYADATGAAACARVDRKGGTLFDTYVRSLWQLDNSVAATEMAYDKIMGRAKEHKDARRPPGAGDCVACGKPMPGTPTHRIRDGFCPAHHKGWSRAKHDGVTRSDYIYRVRRSKGLESTDVQA